jgi:hypothetical protein
MEVCGGDKFINTVFHPGFVKSSATWFVRDMKRLLLKGGSSSSTSTAGGGGVVIEGAQWRDAPVFSLDGTPRRLFEFAPREKGRPLILNFGSWT